MSEKAAQYLRTMLLLNPHENADDIIRRRETAIGLRKPEAQKQPPTETTSPSTRQPMPQSDYRDSVQDENERRNVRTKLKNRIEDCRAKFWLSNASQLRAQLDTIPLKKYPELRGAVDRLKLMTVYKSEFDQIGKLKNKSMNFWNTFKRVVIAAPQRAGQIKEEYIRKLGQSEDLKKVQGMVKTIRSKFPEIYKLESDWFDQIRRLKARKDGYEGVSFDFEIPGWAGWIFWIALITLIRFLFRLGSY